MFAYGVFSFFMGSQGSLAVGNYCVIAFHVSSFIKSKLVDDLNTDFAHGGSGHIILAGDLRLALWLAIDDGKVAFGSHGSASVMTVLQCLEEADGSFVPERARCVASAFLRLVVLPELAEHLKAPPVDERHEWREFCWQFDA
jgi:hypothetical protein